MIHRKQTGWSATAILTLLLLSGLSVQVNADSQSGGVTYSPEHWPERWSSAIRQQQDGRFPTRPKSEAPPPKYQESVSEQDLFYLPSTSRSYGYEHRPDRYEDRFLGQRYLRDRTRQVPRDSAYAYQDIYPRYPYTGFGLGYGGFPYGTAPLGIDPVLGHPGIGIPIMPGTPYGYPLMGAPYGGYPYGGYPGFGSMNPPFGAW